MDSEGFIVITDSESGMICDICPDMGYGLVIHVACAHGPWRRSGPMIVKPASRVERIAILLVFRSQIEAIVRSKGIDLVERAAFLYVNIRYLFGGSLNQTLSWTGFVFHTLSGTPSMSPSEALVLPSKEEIISRWSGLSTEQVESQIMDFTFEQDQDRLEELLLDDVYVWIKDLVGSDGGMYRHFVIIDYNLCSIVRLFFRTK